MSGHSDRAEKVGAAETAGDVEQRDAESKGRHALAVEIEENLWRAAALNDLAAWVGRAGHFIERVRQASLVGDRMTDVLRAHGIEQPEWLDHHAHGLEALHHEIGEHLRAARAAAGV